MSEHYRANWGYLFGDGTAFTIAFGSFADMLPPIAAGLSIIWLGLRIYDDPTVKRIGCAFRHLFRKPCDASER